MKDILDLLGRIFLSMIFFWEAYDSIAFYDSVKRTMTNYGITWNQDLLLIACITFLIVGAMCLLLGYRASMGALLLLCYWIPITFIVYSFWNDPVSERRMQSILFMKNMAIIGGLLMVAVNGSGKFSIKRMIAASRPPKPRW
ncbi:MAG: DoxX family protein [Saprospiraceae bacterium]